MRIISAGIIAALLLPAGAAVVATAQDNCMAEEKKLRKEVAEACSGFSYLFNPSGCFIAQKALKKFGGDNCRAMKVVEKTGPEPPQPIMVVVPARGSDSLKVKAPLEQTMPEPDVEQLKAENTRLKEEVVRLRAELEQLGKK